jgi:hypothetical protein
MMQNIHRRGAEDAEKRISIFPILKKYSELCELCASVVKLNLDIIMNKPLRTLCLCGELNPGISPRRRGGRGVGGDFEFPIFPLRTLCLCGESESGYLTTEALRAPSFYGL